MSDRWHVGAGRNSQALDCTLGGAYKGDMLKRKRETTR